MMIMHSTNNKFDTFQLMMCQLFAGQVLRSRRLLDPLTAPNTARYCIAVFRATNAYSANVCIYNNTYSLAEQLIDWLADWWVG
jgi:hypothetical protein